MSSSVLDLSLGDIIKKNNRSGRGRRGRGRGRGRRGRGRGRRSYSGGYGPNRSRSRGRGRGRRGRGRGRGRRAPYSNLKNKTIKQIALGHAGKRALKVSAESSPKKVAGAICHCLRIGGVPPALIAKGTTAINQAVKSIAIARNFLEAEDDVDLIAQPSFRGDISHSSGCIIHVRRANKIELTDEDISDALNVTNKSVPDKLAGAVAGRVREKKRVSISAIGPKGVMRAIETIAFAREYLKNERIDVKFTPTMKNVDIDDKGPMVAVYFSCLPRRVQ